VFELPTFEKKIRTAQWGDKMYEWLHFFNHAPEEDEEMVKTHYTNTSVQKAFQVLEKLSADDETRYQAEARELALRDRASELSAAREEGREEGELIGQIRLLQEMQGLPVTSREDLVQLDSRALQDMLQELKASATQ
jgi:predicted transposase/invertase (TIGR01784 family)